MPASQKRSSREMDQLRAKALRGDRLRHLSDSEREWIWRSLLKKVRVAEVRYMVKMTDADYEQALARIERWYRNRCNTYKQQPKVVRPIHVPTPPKKRAWWPFS